MKALCYILTAAAAYFTGCLNPAYFISKRKGIDMRSGGSGYLGTCNSVLMLGVRWGFVVFIHDTGKAVLAVALAEGMEWEAALQMACKGASIAVQRKGAAVSCPTRAEIDEACR